MKKLLLLGLLSVFSFNFAQKKKCMEKEIIFSEDEYIFHSEFNGGQKKVGFSLVKNQTELDEILGNNKLYIAGQKPNEENIRFPKNQKVIVYYLGEFRAGNHRPNGIEKLKLNGDTLEVYLKRKEIKTSPKQRIGLDMISIEPQIQVISTPWMVFSVPKKLNFNNVILK